MVDGRADQDMPSRTILSWIDLPGGSLSLRSQESMVWMDTMNQVISGPAQRQDGPDHIAPGMAKSGPIVEFQANLSDVQPFFEQVLNHSKFKSLDVHL